MDDAGREKLLQRVSRQSATIGVSLPETVTVGDEELPLAEFVIETRTVPGVPPGSHTAGCNKLKEFATPGWRISSRTYSRQYQDLLADAKQTLRGERASRLERLESEPIDRETGETLADEIVGIDRALHALENIRKPGYGETARTASVDDHKRWASFLDKLS